MFLEKKSDYSLLVDTHCHTLASRHALCSLAEVVEVAQEEGLQGIVITDHHPSIRHHSTDWFITAPDDAYFNVFCKRYHYRPPKYIKEGVSISTSSPSSEVPQNMFRVYKSIELNLMDHSPWVTQPRSDLEPFFDLKVAGIHALSHLFQKSNSALENTKVVVNALESSTASSSSTSSLSSSPTSTSTSMSPLSSTLPSPSSSSSSFSSSSPPPFHIFTHPIVSGVPLEMEVVVRECAKKNIALELNHSHLLFYSETRERQKEMLSLIIKYKGRLAVGSDAHVANEIGQFHLAQSLLQEMEFPQELIINRSLKSFDEFRAQFG